MPFNKPPWFRPIARRNQPPFVMTEKQKEVNALVARERPTFLMLFGGSRSGKTFWIVRYIVLRALAVPGSRHAIWRQRLNACRATIWKDTFYKVIELCFPEFKTLPKAARWREDRLDGYVVFPNGSEIWFGGLDSKERTEKILGMEFATIYFGEVSQISYGSISKAITRLAQNTRLPLMALFDCNPPRKQHWSYIQFVEKCNPETGHKLASPEQYHSLRINPSDNPNLPPAYIKLLEGLPPAERKRFLEGEFGQGVEGALWNWSSFKRPEELPDMRRIVVAVDPPAKSHANSAECGIVCVGLGVDNRGYVLADASLKGRPIDWGRAAVNTYKRWRADYIVGEVNQGGDMVEHVLQSIDPRVKFRSVHATRGKFVRAEPVSALYHNGLVYHAGDYGELEGQLVELTPDFDPKEMGYSPDRADALVWGLTELMLGEKRGISSHTMTGH